MSISVVLIQSNGLDQYSFDVSDKLPLEWKQKSPQELQSILNLDPDKAYILVDSNGQGIAWTDPLALITVYYSTNEIIKASFDIESLYLLLNNRSRDPVYIEKTLSDTADQSSTAFF